MAFRCKKPLHPLGPLAGDVGRNLPLLCGDRHERRDNEKLTADVRRNGNLHVSVCAADELGTHLSRSPLFAFFFIATMEKRKTL